MSDLFSPGPFAFAQPQAAELGVADLCVKFQGLSAISNVDLKLSRSVIFGLIGPNGAGKTTLVICLTGFQQPTTGRVLLAGEDTAGWTPTKFRKAGVANWDNVTAGTSSMVGIPTLVGPWVSFAFVAIAVILAHLFQKSGFGLMLRASRDDAVAAASSAIEIQRVRLIAFAISGFVVGAAGGVYAHFLGISRRTFSIST